MDSEAAWVCRQTQARVWCCLLGLGFLSLAPGADEEWEGLGFGE